VKRDALHAAARDFSQGAMEFRLVVNTDDNEIRMVEMNGEETLSDHLHASVRRLDDDLLVRQVFADENVDVILGLIDLVAHRFSPKG
jgi:hypothetical protein